MFYSCQQSRSMMLSSIPPLLLPIIWVIATFTFYHCSSGWWFHFNPTQFVCQISWWFSIQVRVGCSKIVWIRQARHALLLTPIPDLVLAANHQQNNHGPRCSNSQLVGIPWQRCLLGRLRRRRRIEVQQIGLGRREVAHGLEIRGLWRQLRIIMPKLGGLVGICWYLCES